MAKFWLQINWKCDKCGVKCKDDITVDEVKNIGSVYGVCCACGSRSDFESEV